MFLSLQVIEIFLGVRFLENVKNGAMAYMYRNQIMGFFEQAPNLSATAIRAYSDLINFQLLIVNFGIYIMVLLGTQ